MGFFGQIRIPRAMFSQWDKISNVIKVKNDQFIQLYLMLKVGL